MERMNQQYLYDLSFFQLLSDAIYYSRTAFESIDHPDSQRHSRSSVYSSLLTVEAVANCCIGNMNIKGSHLAELDKLNSFAKLDIYSAYRGCGYMDRGSHIFEKVKELKKLRDASVHPKEIKIPTEVTIDDEQYENYVSIKMSFTPKPLKATRLSRSSLFWQANDSRSVLSAIFAFYDYYFVDHLRMRSHDILSVLGNVVGIAGNKHMLMFPDSIDEDLAYLNSVGMKQRFINLAGIAKLNQ